MRRRIDMCGLSSEGSAVHKTMAVAVVLLYLLVASTIDLFHKDECQLAPTDTAHRHVIPNADQCPACTFLAGHSSTASYGPAPVIIECLLISQFSPRIAVVQRNEWAYSITSRAPPFAPMS